MSKLFSLIDVLYQGKTLSDPALWKNRQSLTNALTALLGALAGLLPAIGVDLEVTHEQIMAITGGIVAIAGVFNGYLTIATSDKVGLPPRPGDERAHGDNIMG
jgi:hypothetical protein